MAGKKVTVTWLPIAKVTVVSHDSKFIRIALSAVELNDHTVFDVH